MSATTIDKTAITFRSVLPADEEFLYQLYHSTRVEEIQAWGQFTPQQCDAFLKQQFQAQTTHYDTHYPEAERQIILLNGEEIGRLYIFRGDREIRLMDVALLPDYRQQGIGTWLMGNLIAEATRTNKPITLHVEHFNPALRLYQRLGFQVIEDLGIYLKMEWNPVSEAIAP